MRSEKGQAIIFLAFGFVVFLGFVALAIDGGMLYADRRHAQSSSDASALAGAGIAALTLSNNSYAHPEATYDEWNCGSYWVQEAEWLGKNAAIARGGSNGFVISQHITDTNKTYVTTKCVGNKYSSDRYLDVTVNISDTTETSFAHLLYPQPLRNVVSATARIFPRAPFGFGNAIIALNYDCKGNDGGVTFEGNSNMYVDGGGIFSNACFVGNGTATSVTVTGEDGEPIENVCTGSGCWDPNGKPKIYPTPTEGADPNGIPPASVYIAPPTCISGPSTSVSVTNGKSVTLNPGTYQSISVTGGELFLNPGLYCINGSKGVTINGGKVWGPTDYEPGSEYPFHTGVAFYVTAGDFSVMGAPNIRLTAAMQNSCEDEPCPGIKHPQMTAVLIYLAQANQGSVTLLGDSTSDFTGLIYAPAGTVQIGGTSNGLTSFNAQVVADTVVVHGSPEMTINFDDELMRWTSAKIELAE